MYVIEYGDWIIVMLLVESVASSDDKRSPLGDANNTSLCLRFSCLVMGTDCPATVEMLTEERESVCAWCMLHNVMCS